MKSIFALQQFKKSIILFMTGIACSSLTYVIYTVDPVNTITQYHLQMTSHSVLFSLWRKPPVDIYLNVYIFNITNPVEFLSGKEKLKVQEIGPYVYQEYLVNENVTFNDNDTVTYFPRRTIVYLPEMSVGDPAKDLVNVPNVPYLGASSALHDAGFLVNVPLVQLATMMGAKPILNMSVHEYLWGYEDNLVSLVGNIIPKFINFKKFGLLDRMYDEGDNIVTMILRKNDNMLEEKGRYLSIDKYNGSPGLLQWGYVDTENNGTQKKNTACNTIQGATEGIMFPSYPDKRVTFRVYRKTFCRALPIAFKKEVVTEDGLPGYLYNLKDNFADPPDQNPENECYCTNRKNCIKTKGLMDITPCYYNIPAVESLPHFLGGDPTLLENLEGLKPDREKHGSYVILQPTLGAPIQGHSRMQTNLVVQHTRYNPDIAAFNDLIVPLMWIDMNLVLPLSLKIALKFVLQVLPILQTVLMYLLGIAGITTTILSLVFSLWIFTRQQEENQETNKAIDNFDLRIPLCNGQYSSITILPTFKKITSKSDLLS